MPPRGKYTENLSDRARLVHQLNHAAHHALGQNAATILLLVANNIRITDCPEWPVLEAAAKQLLEEDS